jgi:periplasmic divalent cation tolerance protein
MASEHLIVLCTCPDRQTALSLAEALVERRLAACVNVIPALTSVYLWQGVCETAEEVLLLAKTRRDVYTALEEALSALHPYELPEIVAVGVERGLTDYLAWVDDGVRQEQ